MKKLVIISIVAAMLLASGAAFAQSSQQHDVTVTLPNVLMIRIVNTSAGMAAIASPDAIVFDLSPLTAATFDPEGTYSPTSASHNWDDIVVLANGGGWTVYVSTDNDLFEWSKISITHVDGTVNLPVNSTTELISGAARTTGWQSLGISPADFELELDGTEEAASFTTTVTYSFTNP